MANVSEAGKMPISITRDATGKVQIKSAGKNQISYTLDGGAVQTYKNAIALRQGGNVTAWFTSDPEIKVSNSFEKIEAVATTVINASSVEAGEGNAEHLVDGDPNTYWHTMWSVTMAKYPHWVDFDMGVTRTIKGFTYLPRQDGVNGNIKDYSLQVSDDNKNWKTLIEKGSFEKNSSLKKIMFEKPVTTRYIRFTALSEQNGQDFASGAEMTFLEQ